MADAADREDQGVVSLVILGANGDLARRKLIPALFSLHCKGRLPEHINIIGFSRTPFTDDEFRDSMWDSAVELAEVDRPREMYEEFAKRLCYVTGDLGDSEGISRLADRLDQLESTDRPINRLFYLSIAPALYAQAVEALGAAGLASEDSGWRRLVVEKPFGSDLNSALELDLIVRRVFDETQVFRIDHYLGKETVQNLMVLRFANSIFEPIWNQNYVKNIQITVAEEVDVGTRAGYYDRSGVIRDMLQNHLLQLLTIVAMEPPATVDAESLRNRKVDVLRSIRRLSPDDVLTETVAGQYDGYLDQDGVAEGSHTATYAAVRLFVDNWRWKGVPFYLRTGKAMERKVSEVVVEFQTPPHFIFADGVTNPDPPPNVLAICIQPDEGARLRFQVKVPDRGMEMRSATMEFHYESEFSGQAIPEAYERLLQDAIKGDASLFIRGDQIEESWRIVDPINQAWESNDGSGPLRYAPGSMGPAAADALLAQAGDKWLVGCGPHEDDPET
ncbi:MAG: glucose-6-phosphate dehydrogenase [Chloroflexi bacterium]|nr:glucose-6-phosphate dehydrogenase [Chloroflexota bacterium]